MLPGVGKLPAFSFGEKPGPRSVTLCRKEFTGSSSNAKRALASDLAAIERLPASGHGAVRVARQIGEEEPA